MDAVISQITLVVENQEAALEFYTKQLGFAKKTDYTPPGGKRWVTVGPGGQDLEIALFQALKEPEPNNPLNNVPPGNAIPLVLRVKDCRKAFDELKSRGVEFKQKEPYDSPWGTAAAFSDPDGNMFSIFQPKQTS